MTLFRSSDRFGNSYLSHSSQMFTDSWQRFFVSYLEIDVNEFVGKGGELVGEAGAVLARQVRGPRVRVVLEKTQFNKNIFRIVNVK